ncbi:MAG: S-layer homology domain-containing protein, partial [Bacillota bacterium]|nr:S-layer homology domain-containing protein [Bacillota bacterium]
AFLITLSMIAGLVFTLPASAIGVVSGYTSNVILDEGFESTYNTEQLRITNGQVADGKLNFTLDNRSGFSVNECIDTTINKQYVIDFDIATTAAYSDPWSATFVGVNLDRNSAAPWGDEHGAWIGITKDKLVLWYSSDDSDWGAEDAKYELVDSPVDFESGAKVRLLFQGNLVEMYADNGSGYVLVASLDFSSSDKGVIKSGTAEFDSALSFNNGRTSSYFAVWSNKTVEEEEEGNPDPAPAPAVINVDNIKYTIYGELLMTADQISTLEGFKTAIQDILDKAGTEESKYIENSINRSLLSSTIETIDTTIANSAITSVEAAKVISNIKISLEPLVTKVYVTEYLAKLDVLKVAMDDAYNTPSDSYTKADIEGVYALIENARDVASGDNVTPTSFDNAISGIASKIRGLGIYTEDGIQTYSNSMTSFSQVTLAKDWTERGSDLAGAGYANDKGLYMYFVPRYGLQFNDTFGAYSVEATMEIVSGGNDAMELRQIFGADMWEGDRGATWTGAKPSGERMGSHGVFLNVNGSTPTQLEIYVKNGVYYENGGYIPCGAMIQVPFPDGVVNNKAYTLKVKDYGELMKVYAVNSSDEEILMATLQFNTVKSDGIHTGATIVTAGYDHYTKGTMTVEYGADAGKVVSFSNMAIPVINKGHIGFSSRGGKMYVRDVNININIALGEEILAYDNTAEPSNVNIELGSNDINKGSETSFLVNADFDKLKVIGRDVYKPGTVNVSTADATSIGKTSEDYIVSVDAGNNKLTGNARGTEMISADYNYTTKTYSDRKLITVEDPSYDAAAASPLDFRIDSATISNANTFVSIDKGLELIPVFKYIKPNGNGGYTSTSEVEYEIGNSNILGVTNGKLVALSEGITTVKAKVYWNTGLTNGYAETPEITIEVVKPGTMTLGVNYNITLQKLINAAKNINNYTTEELLAIVDEAVNKGIHIEYTDEIDVQILMTQLKSLSVDAKMEEVLKAYKEAKLLRELYNICIDNFTNSDNLVSYFFTEGNASSFGLDKSKYDDMSKNKQGRFMTRLFEEVAELGTDITIKQVKDLYDSILETTKAGGVTNKESSTSKTNVSIGTTAFTSATKPVEITTPQQPVKLTSAELIAIAEAFKDANDAAWAKEAMGSLKNQKIVDGYEDGTIKPNSTIVRDEFAKLVVLTLGLKLSPNNYYFNDIDYSSWQNPYVSTAYENNIIQGIGNGEFGKDLTITRQDMSVMIYRAVQKLGITLPNGNVVAFKDMDNVADYAKEAVKSLAAAGVVNGMGDDTFAPNATATRAQAMYMLNELLKLQK